MLLMSHSPVVLRASHPFFRAHSEPSAAADTPHCWSTAISPMSPWMYVREVSLSFESSPNTCCSRVS